MRVAYVLGGTVVAAALLIGVYALRDRKAPVLESVSELDRASHNERKVADGALPARLLDGQPENRARSSDKGLAQLKIGDPLYQPKNEADVRWLVEHGYPTAEQLQTALKTPGFIGDLSKSLDPSPFEVIQAGQIAMTSPQDQTQAMDVLARAATNGSLYALQELSRVNASPLVNDPVSANAYKAAADMLGDWGSALTGAALPVSAEQQAIATAKSYQIIQNLNYERRQRGLPPLTVTPRPGVAEFLSAIAAKTSNSH